MAGDDAQSEEVEGEEGGEEAASGRRRRLSGRSLVLFVAAPLAGLALLGGGAYFAGAFDAPADTVAEIEGRPKVFFELPEMLVNLADHGEARARYLKLQASLELPDAEVKAALEPVLPRVIDLFQVYLRELRSTDLDGSAGIYRLKEELVRRVNVEITPRKINDVLFKEIIVQ